MSLRLAVFRKPRPNRYKVCVLGHKGRHTVAKQVHVSSHSRSPANGSETSPVPGGSIRLRDPLSTRSPLWRPKPRPILPCGCCFAVRVGSALRPAAVCRSLRASGHPRERAARGWRVRSESVRLPSGPKRAATGGRTGRGAPRADRSW